VRARALRACGVFAHDLGDDQAAGCYAESLELFRSADAKQDAGVLANLGLLAANQSQFGRAVQLVEESLQLRRAVGDVLGIALSLDNLGMLAPGQVRECRGEEGEDCECQCGGSRQLDREDL
jgi:hypothetical protein